MSYSMAHQNLAEVIDTMTAMLCFRSVALLDHVMVSVSGITKSSMSDIILVIVRTDSWNVYGIYGTDEAMQLMEQFNRDDVLAWSVDDQLCWVGFLMLQFGRCEYDVPNCKVWLEIDSSRNFRNFEGLPLYNSFHLALLTGVGIPS